MGLGFKPFNMTELEEKKSEAGQALLEPTSNLEDVKIAIVEPKDVQEPQEGDQIQGKKSSSGPMVQGYRVPFSLHWLLCRRRQYLEVSVPVFQEWWRCLSHSLFPFDHHRLCTHVLLRNHHGTIHAKWRHQDLGRLSYFQRSGHWHYYPQHVC